MVCSTDPEIKKIVTETVVHDEGEKDALVNYESMSRAAQNAPDPEPEKTAPSAAPAQQNTVRSSNPLPGIIAAVIFLLLALAAAWVLPKKLQE